MINKLINIISREAELFESFLELLERQKTMLVENNPDGLIEITELQREKLTESQILNKEREKLIKEIAQVNAIDEDLTVSRLLEIADESQASHLLQLKELILDLNNKIVEARNTNAMLLNQSREFIARTMNMLAKVNNPENTYTQDGAGVTNGSNVMVDRRI